MKTVAIIGASNDRRKFGNKAVRAYLQQGYTVYPVNPKWQEIEGVPAFKNILHELNIEFSKSTVNTIIDIIVQLRVVIERLTKNERLDKEILFDMFIKFINNKPHLLHLKELLITELSIHRRVDENSNLLNDSSRFSSGDRQMEQEMLDEGKEMRTVIVRE